MISPVQPQPLTEFVGVVGEELGRQGVPSSVHASFPEPRRGLVYLFVSPRDYVREHGSSTLPEAAILRRTVFLGSEDPADLDPAHLERLRGAGAVFDISQAAVSELHRLGIPARLLRPGFVERWDRFDPLAPRPIDIMFYGSRSARRSAQLAAAADVLGRHGCLIHIAGDGVRHRDSPAWLAAGRWPLLAQSKLVINLHRGEESRLEWLRAIDAMHSGAVLVTEHASGLAPFVAGEHLLVSDASAIAHVAEAALRDETRLAGIRESAHARLRDWLPLSASVAVLRAAFVELVGRPVAAGMFLGVSSDGSRAAAASDDPSLAGVQDQLRDARREMSEMRREVGRLRAELRWPADPPRVIYRSPAWAARRAPRVSVLLAVDGEGAAALDTLESIAASRQRWVEIIAALDGQAREVEVWARAHPRLAVTLLHDAGGRGRGAARNLALNFARAPTCFVVEPGQRPFPRCLGELLAALDGTPEAAFVYPIQVVNRPAGESLDGAYLENTAAWDAAQLEPGFVSTPALIRTALLRDAGGYRDDRAIDESVDDDLWRRLAAREHAGTLVPQVLSRR